MKRIVALLFVLVLLPGAAVFAQEGHEKDHGDGSGPKAGGHSKALKQRQPRNNNSKVRQNRAGSYSNGGNNRSNQGNGYSNNNRTQTVNHNSQNNWNRQTASNRPVSARFQKMGIHSYPKPIPRGQILVTNRQQSSITYPNRGPNGTNLRVSVIARTNFSSNIVVRNQMATINNVSFRASINNYNATENRVGFYYWHNGGGYNYCHYYDHWGYHWYGWYMGNSCFWTRWYSNNWWWYDPTYYRWCYWHDGGWWWQDPNASSSVYVYVNGQYVSSADPGTNVNVTVNGSSSQSVPSDSQSLNSQPAPEVQSAPPPAPKTWNSTDGTRMVKVTGTEQDAFLYDSSGKNSFKAIYLSSNVKNVSYSGSGDALQITIILNDGSSQTFDSKGNSLDGGSSGDGSVDNSSQNQSPPGNGGNPPGSGT